MLLEIGPNSHRRIISCEIANTGRYDLIIPFGGWHEEHPLKNIADPSKWVLAEPDCHAFSAVEAVVDLFDCDETVASDVEA